MKDQTDATQNGIYVSASGAWSRSSDANSAAGLSRIAVTILGGTVNASRAFGLSLMQAQIAIGTTALPFIALPWVTGLSVEEAARVSGDAALQSQLTGASASVLFPASQYGSNVVGGYTTALIWGQAAFDGTYASVSVYASVDTNACLMTLRAPNPAVPLVVTPISKFYCFLKAGLNTITAWKPAVLAGDVLGIYCESAAISYDAALGTYALGAVAGNVSSPSTTLTIAFQSNVSIGYQLVSGTTTRTVATELAVAQRLDGDLVKSGPSVVAAQSSGLVGGYVLLDQNPAAVSGVIDTVSVYVSIPTMLRVAVMSLVTTNVYTVVSYKDFWLTAGLNILDGWHPQIAAGQYVAIYASANNALTYSNT